MTKSNVRIAAVLATIGAALSVPVAFAATDTATMAVSTTVNASCSISATALAFGSYDPVVTHASTPLDGTGTVTIACTSGAAVDVDLDFGLNAGAGTQRKLLSGTDTINYDLFSDSGRTTAWDNTEANDVNRTGTGADDVLTVYGRVPAGQTGAPSGTYTDTVTATVNF